MISELILIESETARNLQLEKFSHDQSEAILIQVKSLYFALWKGNKIISTNELVDFFELDSTATVRQVFNRHKQEFTSDGVKTIKGKDLRQVRDIMSRSSSAVNLTIWTPRAVLRLAMLLRDSEIAKVVRTSLLDIVEKVVPAQSEEIEKLKLQLELAKTQEKLLMSTQAIATLHSPEMVALVLGKPDAVITQVEEVPIVVTVDERGKAISQFDGVGITALAKRYGFGKNTKACRKWLESIGIAEEQWLTEPSLIKSKKLPREMLTWLDKQFAYKKGTRQTLIGE